MVIYRLSKLTDDLTGCLQGYLPDDTTRIVSNEQPHRFTATNDVRWLFQFFDDDVFESFRLSTACKHRDSVGLIVNDEYFAIDNC